jgi:biopolymer transport protein ExbD
MRPYSYTPAPQPDLIASINTTPLIDVMLVLLIMIILSIPRPTHKIGVNLPIASASNMAPPPVNRIDLSANGGLSWNGTQVTRIELDRRLSSHVGDARHPVLQIATDPTGPYDRFDLMLGQVKRAGVEAVGFVANPQNKID